MSNPAPRPIGTVRDPSLSLWQSAVAEVCRKELRDAGDEHPAENVYSHPLVRAATAHVKAAYRDEPIPPVSPELLAAEANATEEQRHQIQVALSDRYYELAEATRRGDGARVAELHAQVRKYSDADIKGWIRCLGEYLAFDHFDLVYRDWLGDGHGDPKYGVVDYRLPNDARVAIIGDWATGMDDAVQIFVRVLRDYNVSAVIHVGDVYYAGTPAETDANFAAIVDRVSAEVGRRVPIFTIPGNHDYYAKGKGFYPLLDSINDPKKHSDAKASWRQEASYFCLRTEDDRWQFLGMDTGYNDHNPIIQRAPWLEPSEIAWHRGRLKEFPGATILLSHHQLFSANSTIRDSSTPWLNEYLLAAFQPYFADEIAVWYWGHEHNQVLYASGLYGLAKGRLVGASAYEETVAEDPYAITYKEISYLDPEKYRLDASQGYYNHGFAIIDLARTTPTDGVKATYYQYPSWAGVESNPPDKATEMYSETIAKPVPPPIGNPLRFGDRCEFVAQGGDSIIASIGEAEYYPRLGAGSPVTMRVIGSAGEIKDGARVQIQTTEGSVGKYNRLSAWKLTKRLYYYKPGYNNDDWTIHKFDASGDSTIHSGERVYFLSCAFPGQCITRYGTGEFLTSAEDAEFVWRLESREPTPTEPVSFGEAVKLRSQDGLYVVAQEEFYVASAAAEEYHPRLGHNAIRLEFVGGTGILKDGAEVEIKTTERSVGAYNLLGTWRADSLYYYKPGYKSERWRIRKKDTSVSNVIHYGEEFAILNESYVGQWMRARDQKYLTTVTDADYYWTVEK